MTDIRQPETTKVRKVPRPAHTYRGARRNAYRNAIRSVRAWCARNPGLVLPVSPWADNWTLDHRHQDWRAS